MPRSKKNRPTAGQAKRKARKPMEESIAILRRGAGGVLGPGMVTPKQAQSSDAAIKAFHDGPGKPYLNAEGLDLESVSEEDDAVDDEDEAEDYRDPWGIIAPTPTAPTPRGRKTARSKRPDRAKTPPPSTQVLADDDEKTPEKFAGKWRIVETEVWGEDALDLVVPAYIRFDDDDRMGYFQMIAISGSIDCRFDGDLVEFTWIGDDDGELTGGRGWAKVTAKGTLEGRIFIHQGDDFEFVAKRVGKPKRR